MRDEEIFLNKSYKKIKELYPAADVNLYPTSLFIKLGETVYVLNYVTSPVLWIFSADLPSHRKISSIDDVIDIVAGQ